MDPCSQRTRLSWLQLGSALLAKCLQLYLARLALYIDLRQVIPGVLLWDARGLRSAFDVALISGRDPPTRCLCVGRRSSEPHAVPFLLCVTFGGIYR